MIYKDRMTAKMEGDFVVFLIGMRINKPLAVHKYFPVLNAMPKMLTELYTKPEMGFIHHEMWFSRTIILVQYWRSIEQLIDYAKKKDSAHLPAWQAFNKAVGAFSRPNWTLSPRQTDRLVHGKLDSKSRPN